MASPTTTSFTRLLRKLAKCNSLTARDFGRIAASSEPFNPVDLNPALTILQLGAYRKAFTILLTSRQLDWRSVRTEASRLMSETIHRDIHRRTASDQTNGVFVATNRVLAQHGRLVDCAIVGGPSMPCCVVVMLRDDRTKYLTAVSLTNDTRRWPAIDIPGSSCPRVTLATYFDGCIWVPVVDHATGVWNVVDVVSGSHRALQCIPPWSDAVQLVSVRNRGLQLVVGTRPQRHAPHLDAIVFEGLDAQPDDQGCQRVPLEGMHVERVRALMTTEDGHLVAVADTSTDVILFQVFGPLPPRT